MLVKYHINKYVFERISKIGQHLLVNWYGSIAYLAYFHEPCTQCIVPIHV